MEQIRTLPFQKMSNSDTRVAIVTGAAQGIGRAIAIRLAKDGYDIAVSDLASKNSLTSQVVLEIKKLGRNAVSIPADISVEKDVQNMVQQTLQTFNGLDVVSNLPWYLFIKFILVLFRW